MDKPLISVIIPAYNEEKYIATTLNSLKKQNYKNVEIIVVANNCTDKTVSIAAQSADIVLQTDIQGISFAKNLGAESAKGEILVFLDADSLVKKDLLEKVLFYINKGFDGGRAKIKPISTNPIKANLIYGFSDIKARIGAKIPKVDFMGSGAFTFVTRKLFDKIFDKHGEGFNTKLMVFEDVDFFTKIKQNGKFKYISNSYIYSSMRRYDEEGYVKCLVEDTVAIFKKNNARKRWNL